MNPDEPLRTKNLAKEDPAPMDDTLGGYVWLRRMVDKARAAAAHTLGEHLRYPCPIDRHCLQRLGLTSEIFQDVALTVSTGRELLRRLAIAGAASLEVTNFDWRALLAELHAGES